ncbi:hypothetical protein [Vibrio crassostreae]|uniref:Uncharacterized protein n=1 Tax=Vibrio crassostreae TaxID=246167 RepID=A0A822MNI3_9VIBR|nr:hypothetical protein [Vibrio crassostreae]MDH5951610.1 hypothetical protein [Vibrio crassostreae]TCN04668.1 hypothetical protein EDB35_12238 [Vibrio crassostreae]TCU06752.1 hypothetical protein EDB32_113112 [Vibrio crassostreae]CAK2094870.1 conserved hypothetical protein [Vibrio crassostreae]CAK2883582.1 conserved hypothetical protein [Vibrio crassostreae]
MTSTSRWKKLFYEITLAGIAHRKQSYQELDPQIASAVHTLNAIEGVATIGSCQGHVAWLTGRFSAPYLYFTAPVWFANQLSQRLKTSPWHLSAMFNNHCQLCFHLTHKRYSRAYRSLVPFSLTFHLGYHREKANKELAQLAQLLSTIEEIIVT